MPLYPKELPLLEAPATPAKLTYRGGHLLTAAEVVATFWGDAWKPQPQSELLQKKSAVLSNVLQHNRYSRLSEACCIDIICRMADDTDGERVNDCPPWSCDPKPNL